MIELSVTRRGARLLHSQCSGPRSDTCRDLSTVREYSCGPTGWFSTDVRCGADTACSNGMCQCQDSDGGWNYYDGGSARGYTDTCLDSDTLREYGCGAAAGGERVYTGSPGCDMPVRVLQWTGTYGIPVHTCRCEDTDGRAGL